MRLIAHRGLMHGPDKENENKPEQLELAWQNDFDCEVDIWRVDNKWFLGHDGPSYLVDDVFVMSAAPRSWFHCKNHEAMLYMTMYTKGLNFFWHNVDDYTLTSFGYLWVYPEKPVNENSVVVVPEVFLKDLNELKNYNCFGICSDYVEQIREILK